MTRNEEAERLTNAWGRYREWLRAHHPSFFLQLRPPASDSSLHALAEAMGRPLPEEVVAQWLLNDGQQGEHPGLLAGFQFLPVETALSEWRVWAELRATHQPRQLKALGALASSLPGGAIRRAYTCEGWLPLWKEPLEGNYLGVDLSPGERGTSGQVINFGRDEDDKAVLAPSLTEVVEWLAAEAEAGRIVLREYKDRRGESAPYLMHAGGRVLTVLLKEARQRLAPSR
ncbi:SMI1/KNR4 family protein [Pyxidicoccus sp. MSG2]|nr:SMI1/KNR4 family protein [Pyxidicoccus sp. MSG2]